MKVLIVLALVAAASCAPANDAKEGEREKRNLIGSYPLGYSTGFNSFGVSSGPLVSNQVQQQESVESQHVQTSNLKSTSTKSLLQPTYQTYQTYQPAIQTYQTYQPSVQAYQTYQPANYVSYQQPAYYSTGHAQVVPVQSSYYNVPSSVQYVSQPAFYNNGYNGYQQYHSSLPSYSVSSPVVTSNVVSSGVVGTDPWC